MLNPNILSLLRAFSCALRYMNIMFPIKGWSLPASALKPQSITFSAKSNKESKHKTQSNGSIREIDKKSKKRKRDHGKSTGLEVTKDNVAELWGKHIGGILDGGSASKKVANGNRKMSKNVRQEEGQDSLKNVEDNVDQNGDVMQEAEVTTALKQEKTKKKRKKGPEHEAKDTSLLEIREVQAINLVSPRPVDGSKPDKKKRKKAKQENGGPVPSETVMNIDHVAKPVADGSLEDVAFPALSIPEDATKSTSNVLPDTTKNIGHASSKEANKAKFECRKAVMEAKRQQRALLQSEGAVAPERSAQPTVVEDASKAPVKAVTKKNPQPPITEAAPNASTKSVNKKKSQVDKDTLSNVAKPTTTPTSQPEPKIDSLTPLQKSMRDKLTSARFRHLNQTLYTTPSNSTLTLFSETPTLFDDYHAGFRAQVATWPENPVDKFAADIKLRGRTRIESQKGAWRKEKRGKSDDKPIASETTTALETGEAEPLPRTRGACTIVDLGCGDAVLARSLQKDIRPSNLKILSYDLAKGTSDGKKFIKIADIANLPLEDGSVDLAIFCLALMGTNWVDFIDEAARVVRWKGELWVAEIKSRFGRVGRAKKDASEGKTKKGKKASKEEQQREDEEAVVEEIDGAGKGRQETDVGAFVEVLRKRGFLLKGEAEMDNKMFVTLRFCKAGPTTKGKMKKEEQRPNGDGKPRFIDMEEEEGDEGRVLKPCVYKTR